MIRFRIRNVFRNGWLLLEWLILLFLLFRTLWPHFILYAIPDGYDMLSVISIPLSLSAVSPFASVFCSFPVSSIFPTEYNEGFTKSALMRSCRNRYIRGLFVETLFAGGLAIAVPYAILFFYAAIKAGPASAETLSQYYQGTVWHAMALRDGGYSVLLWKTILAALFGWVWSLMGLLMSTLFLNRYIGAIAPFIVCQTLWALLTNSKFNPVYLLNANGVYWSSIFEIVAIQMILCAFLIFLTARLLRWRCKNV